MHTISSPPPHLTFIVLPPPTIPSIRSMSLLDLDLYLDYALLFCFLSFVSSPYSLSMYLILISLMTSRWPDVCVSVVFVVFTLYVPTRSSLPASSC